MKSILDNINALILIFGTFIVGFLAVLAVGIGIIIQELGDITQLLTKIANS